MVRKFFWLLAMLTATNLGASQVAVAFEAFDVQGRKPNVLFLFADDFSYEALGHLRNFDIQTPNLDRLASRGISFRNAYNMGSWSGAVCVASRNMLLTGRSVWQAQKVANNTEALREAGQLWPGLMKGAGYDTYLTGKWHIQANPEKSFDVAKHVRPGMPKTVEASYNRPASEGSDNWRSSDKSLGGFWEGGKHWTEVAADDAIEFLELSENSQNPFFMYIAFNAPHDPRQAPEEYLAKYPVESVEVPKNFLPEYPYKNEIGCGQDLRDERLGPFPRTEYSIKVHRREYYALITHLDAQIGRILDALEQSSQSDNTWVIFTADHGLAVGHHGLFGKQNMYDHSLRVPFIVSGPQVKQGEINTSPIYLQDAMATALDLAGVTKPETCEFQSLAGVARGNPNPNVRDAVYGAYLQVQRCVIHDGWKLIVYPKAKKIRLYNLNADPQELSDLSVDSAHRTKIDELATKLKELQTEFEDTLHLEDVANW